VDSEAKNYTKLGEGEILRNISLMRVVYIRGLLIVTALKNKSSNDLSCPAHAFHFTGQEKAWSVLRKFS